MKTFLLTVFVILISTSSSFAGWKLDENIDAMTDKVQKTTYIESTDGSRFTLIRKSDKSVWGYIKLSGMNQFMINDRLMLRVDKNKPFPMNDDLQKLSKQLGVPKQYYEWNPSLIGGHLWHGKIEEGCFFVGQLLKGERLIVRYHPNRSTFRDLIFDINGSQNAITESLGLMEGGCK